MTTQKITNNIGGRNSVNPIIFTSGAAEIIEFIVHVFGGEHDEGALTYDPDGTIFHSEVHVDDTTFIVAERKAGWPFTPAFTQIYVYDVAAAIERAVALGATIITEPTDYVGVTFSRVQDPYGNIWWIWAIVEDYDWEAAFGDYNDETSWKPTDEAIYVHDTLITALEKLGNR